MSDPTSSSPSEPSGGASAPSAGPAASKSAWIVYCPDESSQIGGLFDDSETALQVCNAHNADTLHNANIQAYYNAP